MNTKGVEDGTDEQPPIARESNLYPGWWCVYNNRLGTNPYFPTKGEADNYIAKLPKPAELELKGEGGDQASAPATESKACPDCGTIISRPPIPECPCAAGLLRRLFSEPSAAVPVEERTATGHEFSTPDGELDEVFIKNASVHIERMDDMCFWIGIDSPGKHSLHIRTGVEDGVWWFSVEEDALSDGKYLKVERTITPLVPERTAEMDRLLLAAKNMDWMQVVLNGGPPCFHLDEDGSFCGRAQRWDGHTQPEAFHEFISLERLLLDHIEGKAKAVSQEVKE